MKLFGLGVCLAIYGSVVAADEWRVQYLSFSGGTRAIQETQGEHQFAEAYFRNDAARVGLRIGCASFEGERRTTIQFSDVGDPVFGRSIDGVIVLGGTVALTIGNMDYERGGYHGVLQDRHLAYLSDTTMRDMVFEFTWTDQDGANEARFDMVTTGLTQALAGIECQNG